MKKFSMGLALIAAMLLSVPAFAWEIKDSSASHGAVKQLTFGTGFDVTESGGVHTVESTPTLTADLTLEGTTPLLTIGDAGAEDAGIVFDGNAQDFYFGLDDSVDDLIIGLGDTFGTTPIITMTDVGHTTITGSTDGILTIYGAGTTASDAYLRLVGDAQADATDSWQFFNDTSAASLLIGNDSSAAGTYVTKATLTSAGALSIVGDFSGDGGDQLYGFNQEQVASTSVSITAAQAGVTFVSNSADVMVLPEASTVLGARYTFIAGTADDFDINPADGTDQILPITASGGTISPSAGDAIRLTDAGASVTLEAIGADAWACVAHNGAITDVN